jgi:hypothetical protein
MFDRLSLALGRPLPGAVNGGLIGLWWALFALGGVSLLPAAYAALQGVIASSRPSSASPCCTRSTP